MVTLVRRAQRHAATLVPPAAGTRRVPGRGGASRTARTRLRAPAVAASAESTTPSAVDVPPTRSFYRDEPPQSTAPTGCEMSAVPVDFPRGAPISCPAPLSASRRGTAAGESRSPRLSQ